MTGVFDLKTDYEAKLEQEITKLQKKEEEGKAFGFGGDCDCDRCKNHREELAKLEEELKPEKEALAALQEVKKKANAFYYNCNDERFDSFKARFYRTFTFYAMMTIALSVLSLWLFLSSPDSTIPTAPMKTFVGGFLEEVIVPEDKDELPRRVWFDITLKTSTGDFTVEVAPELYKEHIQNLELGKSVNVTYYTARFGEKVIDKIYQPF